jgi:nucleoside-diphosphate-sugar epimerase
VRIAVTGAHGFVGSNVVKTLAQQGHRVFAIARNDPDAWIQPFLHGIDNIEHIQCDLAERGNLAAAFRGSSLDAFIHAAVVTATTLPVERDAAATIVHVNIGGTIEALEAARGSGAQRFVYVSSPSAFGDVDPEAERDESIGKAPTTLYGISKDASEEICRRYASIWDLSAASVRIAQPYGLGERATSSRVRTSPIYEWICDAQAGRELPTGPLERSRDWTWIDETARGLAEISVAAELRHDLYHLSCGKMATVGEVVEQIRSSYPDASINTSPEADLLNPNIAGSGSRRPLNSQRFRDEFGWSPEVGIEDGMRRYLEWWKAFPASMS